MPVEVVTAVAIGGETYRAASGVMDAIDKMAKVLTGDETLYHAGSSSPGSDDRKWLVSTLDWFLSDPALILPKTTPAPRQDGMRIRFRSDSTFVRNMDLPARIEGVVAYRYEQDGVERLNVQLDGLFAMGVDAREVEEI